MNIKNKKILNIEQIGKIIGFIFMFFIFSMIFNILVIKPNFSGLGYIGSFLITLSIVLTGTLIKLLFKC